MNKIKLTANILFSGIGCQERGFQNSNIFDLEVLNTSEINKEAILTYAAIHCGLNENLINTYTDYPTRKEMAQHLTDINFGYDPEKDKYVDWFKMAKKKNKDIEKYWLACKLTNNLGDISKIQELPYADLWTCSFPCFTEDTLVLTKEYGYIPIKDIKKGMSVLTHNNTYQPVIKAMKTGEKNIFKINAMSFDKIECTENHKFFVRTKHRKPTQNKNKSIAYRYFYKPIWKECKDLNKNDYLGYAINQNSIIPQWKDSSNTKVKLSTLMNNENFWWIIGRYIADGYKLKFKTGNRIILCCGKSKVPLHLIEENLDLCGLNYCTDDHRTCFNYHICSNELYDFVSQFGDKAYGKFIPAFVFDMPINLCKAFLDGYWSGDGCFTQNRYKANSVSKNLIYGLGQLIAKVYHRPFSIYYTKTNPLKIIEGRTVNQKDWYSISFKKENSKQDKAFYEDGYIWFPINEIINSNTIKSVYDITVEQDHSFTANGAIVHNCTDISIAGKMKGLNPNNKTRSSLLWENMKLLAKAKENNTLPKYIMFENVRNLVSERFINDFNDLISILDNDLGYNTYWKILNAKDCKIPQNRERVFVFCIRKDIDNKEFNFPKPIQSDITINDILDNYFDPKYWLSDQIQERLQITDSTFTKNVIGTTKPEFRTIGQKDVVYHKHSIMGTLLATDYKQPKQIFEDNGKVRRITPNECFKLQGLTSEDCEKARELGLADINLYKQAGNGIVTNCCELIAEHLYKAQYNNKFICTDEREN